MEEKEKIRQYERGFRAGKRELLENWLKKIQANHINHITEWDLINKLKELENSQ